ncbi:alpha/beta hydrolase [Nesterenkonia pannonica]|uniref:alpha/beta fold hydrolase n=1 Tax=Nesterenkonia pannonica TaxID=1548602 RepID=UPI0021646BBC|nr:alpha/beta hydrolase [Nesterenkonia pannonica]
MWEHPRPLSDPVLLVHGYGSNTLFNWVKTGWLDPMADLGRSIISIDMPGHGDAKSTDPAGMRTGDLVDDLHQVITQHGVALPCTAIHWGPASAGRSRTKQKHRCRPWSWADLRSRPSRTGWRPTRPEPGHEGARTGRRAHSTLHHPCCGDP